MISAMEFYGGYCMTSQKSGYLPIVLSSTMNGIVKLSDQNFFIRIQLNYQC